MDTLRCEYALMCVFLYDCVSLVFLCCYCFIYIVCIHSVGRSGHLCPSVGFGRRKNMLVTVCTGFKFCGSFAV